MLELFVYKCDMHCEQFAGRVPIKWMSPESMASNIYTTKSDV